MLDHELNSAASISQESRNRASVAGKLVFHAQNGLEQWQGYFLQQAQISASSEMPEYRNNYRLGLKSWFSNTYLQLEALMGDRFTSLVEQYIDQVPLDVSNMNEFEKGFLLSLKAESKEYYDVGLVDLLIHQSYYAKDGPRFPFEQMAKLSGQQQADLQFCMAPFVYGLESYLPLDSIWHAYRQADLKLARDLVLHPKEWLLQCFLIRRDEYRPEVIRLSGVEAELFNAIQAGLKLAEISEDGQGILPSWIQTGIVTGIKTQSV